MSGVWCKPVRAEDGHRGPHERGPWLRADYRELQLAALDRASEKRAQVIALAMVLGAAEHGVRDVHAWQSDTRGCRAIV